MSRSWGFTGEVAPPPPPSAAAAGDAAAHNAYHRPGTDPQQLAAYIRQQQYVRRCDDHQSYYA